MRHCKHPLAYMHTYQHTLLCHAPACIHAASHPVSLFWVVAHTHPHLTAPDTCRGYLSVCLWLHTMSFVTHSTHGCTCFLYPRTVAGMPLFIVHICAHDCCVLWCVPQHVGVPHVRNGQSSGIQFPLYLVIIVRACDQATFLAAGPNTFNCCNLL